jgi:hypothetical protein
MFAENGVDAAAVRVLPIDEVTPSLPIARTEDPSKNPAGELVGEIGTPPGITTVPVLGV